ncbi:hypothetical protein [Capnocytophaga sp. H2931]|uniref:hypothetical protein n=1 Tax=Capnocytophaga sp. H2931 TaxID=1945657 RepID=UPI000BB1E29D|nr:hypothetical protein [Capnocytophaga sp. H2931]ATA75017.1 hypothetical protein CGC52_06050 [Capnocytophaga sp. H2931]
MSDKLSFYFLQLIEEANNGIERFKTINENTFDKLEDYFHILHNEIFYEIIVSKHSDYIWINIDYGNPMPKDENLTNIITGNKLPNKREDDEVELTSQLFILYHYKNNVLYISNIKKMKFINEILSQKLDKKFIVKKHLKTQDEFIKTLKSVSEISFTDVNNLFNDNEQRKALKDLTGTDAPEKFKITAHYSNNFLNINFLKKLLNKRGTNSSSLVIKGTDENNFNFVYNQHNFVKLTEINCKRKSNGKFDSEDVLNNLLKSI